MAAGHRQLGRVRDLAARVLYKMPEGETVTFMGLPIERVGKDWYKTPHYEGGRELLIERLQRHAKLHGVSSEPALNRSRGGYPFEGPALPPGTKKG
jgi:hypothetical protein